MTAFLCRPFIQAPYFLYKNSIYNRKILLLLDFYDYDFINWLLKSISKLQNGHK